MTRKEFLIYLGVLLFAVSGISGLFEKIAKTQKPTKTSSSKHGFGDGAYGA